MLERLKPHRDLVTRRTWWSVACVLVLGSVSHEVRAQHTPMPEPAHHIQTAWMPDASSWQVFLDQARIISSRPPLSSADVVWEASRCELDASGRLRSCEAFRREDGARTFSAERITWREDGELELAQMSEFEWGATSLRAAQITREAERTRYTGVVMSHEESALTLSSERLVHAGEEHEFFELVWRSEGNEVSSASSAWLEEGKAWHLDTPRYGAWVRREKLDTSSHQGPVGGVLPPRVLALDGELLVGAEAIVAAPYRRGLFAGAFVAPQSSSFGASVGLGMPEQYSSGVYTTHTPLRLQVGLDDEEVEASLHGDTTFAWRTHDHVALHAEEGHRRWLDRSVVAEAGELRSWRQSRAGVSLGSEETVLQATGIHQTDPQSWWGAYLASGGRYRLTAHSGVDFAVEHRSHIITERDQDHRTEVTPGWFAQWGRRDRLHASAFAGFGIMQQSFEDEDRTGIATANRMAALSMVQAGASLEGRAARSSHRIEPQMSLYVAPLSWSRRPTRVDDQDQTRAVQTNSQMELGGVALLQQAITNLNGRAGLEFPVAAMAWQRVTRGGERAQEMVLTSDARGFYTWGEHRPRLDLGGWWCGGDARAMVGHVAMSRPGKWGIDYTYGNASAQMLTWRWLGSVNVTPSAVHAGLWQEMFDESERSQTRTQGVRGHATWRMWTASAMGYRQDEGSWGAMSRVSLALRRTGWRIDVMASLRDGEEAGQVVGLGLTWRE